MATRMATLLHASGDGPDATLPLPIHAPASREPSKDDAIATAPTEAIPARHETPPPAPSRAPAPPSFGAPGTRTSPGDFRALPAMVLGLAWTAAVWMGLAMIVFALAYSYSLSTAGRFLLVMIGSWLVAAGAAYALTAQPGSA